MESGSSLSGYGFRKAVAARLWKHEDTQEPEPPKVEKANFDDEIPSKSKRKNSIGPQRPTHQIGNLNAQGSSIALAGEIRDIYVNYHGVSENDGEMLHIFAISSYYKADHHSKILIRG